MDNEKLLTIAIPTYNGAKTIANMLEILLPQCDERVEVLISDNASTDNTKLIIDKYIEKYENIRYVRNVKNIGPDSNYLQCMKISKGKYTLLLSDDDILIEEKLCIILDFLQSNKDMSLVYLNAKGFHEKYENEQKCIFYDKAIYDGQKIVTYDKQLFMSYAGRMWGFLSCFICLTEALHNISDVNKYKGSNWLQSYVHILCADYKEQRLGIISIPCIGAGIYSSISNFDSGRVDGITYRNMLDFAIKYGFSKKQLDELFIWRIGFISKRALIKERAAGIKKTRVLNIIKCTIKYPILWIKLYPFFLIPPFMCKYIVKINNKRKGYKSEGTTVNRQEDVIG